MLSENGDSCGADESRYRNNRRIKASDQLKWVGLMNNTRSAAEGIVVKEIVYI